MAREDLPLNQIAPAARPVDAFVQPAVQRPAAPAELKLMPNPTGIQLIGQSSGGSVEGVNQLAELAGALAPFSRQLMELAGGGVKLYASSEYEKGQNEAMRATVLANQQMLATASEYAAENRRLDKVDPVAALMMDRVNPFRQGGRQNALTRVAGNEILPAVMKAYGSIPGVAELELGHPLLKQTAARAIQGVMQRYGIDAGSPGFIENVLPQISQAESRIFERHEQDHVGRLKDTAWRDAALEVTSIYDKARESGVVEWTEFDPVTGQEIRKTAKLGEDRAGWERGVQILAGQVAKRLADATGITGETTELQGRMFTRLAEMAGHAGNTELARILYHTPVGLADKNGRRPAAGEYFGIEMYEGAYRIEQQRWQDRQRSIERGVEDFKSELAVETQGLADGPERGAAIARLIEKYVGLKIPRSELVEAAGSMSTTIDSVAGRSFDSSQMDSLLQGFQARVGAEWDATVADQEFNRLLSTVAPQERGAARERYAAIRRIKENEKNDIPSNLINPLINAKIKSGLRWAYPDNVTEASLRGADISAMMAWGDADVAKSAQLQLSAYTRHVVARLREAESRKGEKLNTDEILRITTDALAEYGTKNKEMFNDLFPGSAQTDTPSVGGRARPPATTPRPASGTPPTPGGQRPMPAVFPSGQLDNIPNRSERLRNGEPVLALPSLQEEIARIYNGQRPSAAVIRAARDAGFGSNVGKWLLREAGNYDSYDLDPQVRQKLLRSSNDAAGVAGATQVAAAPPSPVQQLGSWWLNVLTGASPSYAGTLSSMRGGGRNGTGPFSDSPVASIGDINMTRLRTVIVGKESGGSFSAVNPDSGALGYGQVMPYNVGPWTQEHYGRRLTPEQFLASREAQLAVVNGQLAKIVRQQQAAGYRGDVAIRRAAAIWYSGNGNLYDDNRPQYSNGRRYPSIREYTLDILNSYKRGG